MVVVHKITCSLYKLLGPQGYNLTLASIVFYPPQNTTQFETLDPSSRTEDGSFPEIGGPQYTPYNAIIIIIIGPPKEVTFFLETLNPVCPYILPIYPYLRPISPLNGTLILGKPPDDGIL